MATSCRLLDRYNESAKGMGRDELGAAVMLDQQRPRNCAWITGYP
jgi:hypothetical protein